EWLKFNNRNFSLDSRKEFRKRFSEIRIKEIECPEGLDFEEFGALHEGMALQNLSYFTFRDHIEELDAADTMVFQLSGERRIMTMRQFIQALRVYTHEEMNNNLFEPFYDSCYRSRPINYDPTPYVLNITTRANYDTRHPPSYTSIQNLIRRLVHYLLTLSVACKHSRKDKVTLDDLFLLHSMDGGVSVDVPWHVATFLCDKAKGSKRKSPIVGAHLIEKISSYYGLMTLGSLINVTLGPETSSMSVAKQVDLGICRYNGLGIGEMVAEIPEVARDDDVGVGQAEIGGVGRHPNMSNTNKLRAMDERLGEIVNNVDELTYVVSGMSKKYDQFYREFGQWQTEQERFISWNTDHLSQLLAHHHIDDTRYDGTHYSYVSSIPDLGVQQGVNFISGTPGYSTAPSPSASQFGMFGDAHPSTSRNQDDMNED
ncbi:hypothetical protein Tco_0983750, partial [Tanacetum coccineum]